METKQNDELLGKFKTIFLKLEIFSEKLFHCNSFFKINLKFLPNFFERLRKRKVMNFQLV